MDVSINIRKKKKENYLQILFWRMQNICTNFTCTIHKFHVLKLSWPTICQKYLFFKLFENVYFCKIIQGHFIELDILYKVHMYSNKNFSSWFLQNCNFVRFSHIYESQSLQFLSRANFCVIQNKMLKINFAQFFHEMKRNVYTNL